MNLRGIFYNYARIIRNYNNNVEPNDDDKVIIDMVKKIIDDDPKYMELVNKLIDSSFEDDMIESILDDYFKKNDDIVDESVENQIAEVFNVSPNDIECLFLNDGNKIFKFYSSSLERDVVLENDHNGKKLVDILNDLKSNNNKYNSTNDEYNSTDMLVDESQRENLEIKMYYVDDVINHSAEIASLNNSEQQLLAYLLENKERYDIKMVNIEHLFFITNSHKIMEISFDKDFKPMVSEPNSEETFSSNSESKTDDSDLSDMFDEDSNNKEDENNNILDKNDVQKKKVFLIDSNGFSNNIILLLLVVIVVILILLFFVFK